jgi:hypothetical protein
MDRQQTIKSRAMHMHMHMHMQKHVCAFVPALGSF